MADFLATYLCEKHIPSTSIHGDRLQDQREAALNDFVKGKRNVLVTTAVASRGLGKFISLIIIIFVIYILIFKLIDHLFNELYSF